MVTDSPSLPELLAKSDPPVSIRDHADAVAGTTAELVERPVIVDRLASFESKSTLNLDTLTGLGSFVGENHDAGKAHSDWQAACRDLASASGEEMEEGAYSQLPPHSARSALYTFAAARERELPLLQGLAATLAVLHHHTPITSNRMQHDHIQESVKNLDGLKSMAESLHSVGYPAISIDTGVRDSFANAVSRYQSLEPRDEEYDYLGALVTVLRTALIQADHYASATAAGSSAPLPERLCIDDISLFDSLRPFQRRVDEADGSQLVGLAGCGEGKTHSALQWGQEIIADDRANRLVFAMPTQVTTNNLLFSLTGGASDEAIAHVPPESAALYHSASETFYRADEAAERWDISDIRLNERARRWFQRPVTVTTVDHVLSTLVNGYDWASVARGNLLQSAVIFDELHAYDEHTTGHILSGIAALDRIGVPWYVMSATIPPQVREHDVLSGADEVRSDGRLSTSLPPREPFTVTVEDDALDIETVLEVADDSTARRVMIVRNTVADARELARRLLEAGEDVVYYSSAFTQPHREQKESEIRERFGGDYESTGDRTRQFLVATQVCEISLDLSADMLLTDVAPIDAVVQRAGRLHRDGVHSDAAVCHETRGDDCVQCSVLPSNHSYECIVYAPLDDYSRWYPYATDEDSISWELLQRTKKVLATADTYRFDRSLQWVDEVYGGLNISFDTTKLSRLSHKNWLYGDPRRIAPDAEAGRDNLHIRDISTYKRAVFMSRYVDADERVWSPTERWQEEHDCPRGGDCGVHRERVTHCDHEFRRFASQYAIEIPRWWLETDDHPVAIVDNISDSNDEITGGEVTNVEYTYKLGIDPKTAE